MASVRRKGATSGSMESALSASPRSRRTQAEQHIFRVFDADASGVLEIDELAETWRALSGRELDSEQLRRIGGAGADASGLTLGQFQLLLREELPHVVELLATVNGDLEAKGKKGLSKREISELLGRVGPKLVSMLEAAHSTSPASAAQESSAFYSGEQTGLDAAERASADFHTEVHSLAAELASAHRDAAQQWTDEEVEIIWLSHDAMERERDKALAECARLRETIANVSAERDALAGLASSTRAARAPKARAAALSAAASGASARTLRPRQQTFGLRNLTRETQDDSAQQTENEGDLVQLPERGLLDKGYLELLDECDADDRREMVDECGVVGIVPEQPQQTADGLRDVLCAYVSGRPMATRTAVCGYLWRKEGLGSGSWKLHWAVLDCAGGSGSAATATGPVLKLCSSQAHESAIRQGEQPPDVSRVSTDAAAAAAVIAIRLQECVEVRRSTAPLATAGELELVAPSRTHRLCTATRGDSRAWSRVLQAAMRPGFGITAKQHFRRAVRKHVTISQFMAQLVPPAQSAQDGMGDAAASPTSPRSSRTAKPKTPPPPPPPPPPKLPHKLVSAASSGSIPGVKSQLTSTLLCSALY
jgi:hypothetical protein|eukprot:COSAG06_NODE_4346_length_4350_cov_12.286756_6_plen_596_part_00